MAAVAVLLNSFRNTAAMKRKLTHCLTLRILPEMDLLVSDAAYDARLSKAAWIRRAIHASIGQMRRTEPATNEPVLR